MPAGEFNYLRHFCLRDLIRKHPAYPDAVTVDVKHDLYRLIPSLVEKSLQYVNDELHRRVIVVQDQHFVQAGPFRFRPRLGHNSGTGTVSCPVALVRPAVFLVAHDL